MSEHFPIFAKAVEARFRELATGELYVVDAVDLFDIYLNTFPEGTNPIFRVRTVHDGSYDKQFIRNVGHVVAIREDKIHTLWDLKDLPHPYDVVAAALDQHIRSLPIRSIFRTKEGRFSMESNVELRDGVTTKFHHFFCTVPNKFRTPTPEAARGVVGTNIGVFRRGVEELTSDAIETVLDLINSNSLYRGAEFKGAVQDFLSLHQHYTNAVDRELFLWDNVSNRAALFRNTVIGTLVVDLSAGVELDHAVRSFEQKVAPMNYKRPTALITPKMIEGAVAKLKDLGLEGAVERRFAKLSDVSVNNVLFVDNSVKSQMKDGLTGLLMESVKPEKVGFAYAEPISMDDFLAQIVPQARSLDVLVENKHLANFMSVTTGETGLFKWNNGFAWSYDGDAADSIKQRVKRAGGNVEADLRVSLAWFNRDDLDLHVYEPNGSHIYYGAKQGKLDVDMNVSHPVRDPVENVVWTGRLADGVYKVLVNQFTKRESIDVGFTLEVEYRGAITHYSYDRQVSGMVPSLRLHVEGGVLVKIEVAKGVVSGSAAQEKWGVTSETLVPVDTLMASPNHWDGQEIGNKHWFFILKGCRNPGQTRGIYNEFLRGSLDEHRKVFEVLGSKSKCPGAEEQLSGVGFSSTRHDQAIVVVKGDRINRAFKVNF